MRFDELQLPKELMDALKDLKFEEATEIQAQSIPYVMSGNDVIAKSATGSGKTLAFGLGILPQIEAGHGISTLILAPTRELAEQIYDVFRKITKYKKMHVVQIYGGVAINPQMDELQTADIVVGTPGRILDHLERRTIDLRNVRHVVLDEADKMLDMGFIDDVNRIMSHVPDDKQMLLFSATISTEIRKLASRHLKDPVDVAVQDRVDPMKLKQVYYTVNNDMKFSLLVHLLKKELGGLVMVFCNSRTTTELVAKNLGKHDIDAMSIHGGLSQSKRSSIIKRFHDNKALVLACTDVAARGLDIPGVSHVYNYDIPRDSKQYIHRIGRTARAGESGKVVNLLVRQDFENFDRVLKERVKIDKEEVPDIEKVNFQTRSSQGRFGDRGPRRDGPRRDGPRRDGPRRDGPRRDGPRREGPRRDGPRHDGPRRDGPRQEGGFSSRTSTPRSRRPSWNQ